MCVEGRVIEVDGSQGRSMYGGMYVCMVESVRMLSVNYRRQQLLFFSSLVGNRD